MDEIASQELQELTQQEAARIANSLRSRLWQGQDLMLFWVPARRNVTTRGTHNPRLHPRRLPEGAIQVGRFMHPCHETVMLAALRETIKALGREAAPA